MSIRYTFSSATYDEDVVLVIHQATPNTERAVQHMLDTQEAYGDGSLEVEPGVDALPTHTEDEFCEWVILDTDDGVHSDEVRAYYLREALEPKQAPHTRRSAAHSCMRCFT